MLAIKNFIAFTDLPLVKVAEWGLVIFLGRVLSGIIASQIHKRAPFSKLMGPVGHAHWLLITPYLIHQLATQDLSALFGAPAAAAPAQADEAAGVTLHRLAAPIALLDGEDARKQEALEGAGAVAARVDGGGAG